MNSDTAIRTPSFPKLHVGFGVRDLTQSIAFYSTLLGMEPTKTRPGYAKFESMQPSVDLTLHQRESRGADRGPEDHFGIRVESGDIVRTAARRLSESGIETRIQDNTACCYSIQTKVWVSDPDGNQWEIYAVIDPDVDRRVDATCCKVESCQC